MKSHFSVAAHWAGDFDERALQRWTEELRAQLDVPKASLGLVFMSPKFFPQAGQILEILRVHARVPLLVGCSSHSLIANGHEIEEEGGLVLGIYNLPGAILTPFYFGQQQLEEASDVEYWRNLTGISPEETNGWLVFADPFRLDCESWLKSWNQAYAPLPVVGGLASGDFSEQSTQVYLNGEAFSEGGVAVSIGGDVVLGSVISQGCTPIGETWTITKAERNFIHEIGNRPAYEVLAETFSSLSPQEQQKSRGNLFVGLVMNEYLDEFHRGDFLIRNLIGADPKSGALAVGAYPRPGQTIQFQRRDAAASTEDMTTLLQKLRSQIKDRPIYGACLCSCNGRGKRLFGEQSHDARHVQESIGPTGLAGFFCNGEIGPVGNQNYLHGYTASVGVFVKKA